MAGASSENKSSQQESRVRNATLSGLSLNTLPGHHHSADIVSLIRESLGRTESCEQEMSDILRDLGVLDTGLITRIGSELEFYTIAGEKSFKRRLRQIYQASIPPESEQVFESALAKDDSYMPAKARSDSLTRAFNTGFEGAHHVIVDKEPAYKLGIATERGFSLDGKEEFIQNIALFQHEIVSPPRRLRGLPIWLNVIGQRIIDDAPNYDLQRAEVVTTLHEMSSCSLHLHISLTGQREGKEINLMSRDSFPEEKGKRKNDPSAPSQLALHVANAINEFLNDYIYLFAPTEDAYVRFSDKQYVGTSFIGFRARKERFNMGSAMFRGGGRETYREEDSKGTPDKGPLRIELRVPDVGSIGHPNKRAYPEQMLAPFDVAEALAYMLKKGIDSYRRSVIQRKVEGRTHRPLTEDALYEKVYDLPRSPGEAAERMRQAQKRGEGFLTPKRLERIIERGLRQQDINALDKKQNLPQGQTEDRSELLKLMGHS